MGKIDDLIRLELFTEQIKEINSLINADSFFLDKLEEVLFRVAGFINASSGLVKIDFNNEVYFFSYGLDVQSENSFRNKPFEKTTIKTGFVEDSFILTIPIEVHDKVIGALTFNHKESRNGIIAFESIDYSLITVVSQQIGLALERLENIISQKELVDLNHSILNSTSTAIVATDTDLSILLANSKAEELFQFSEMNLTNLLDSIPSNSQIRQFISDFISKKVPMAAEGLVFSAQNPRLMKTYASTIESLKGNGSESGFIFSFEDVTQFKKLKDTFSRYVSKDVLNLILDQKGNSRLGGYKRESTILFSDIRGFTSYSEANEPEEVVDTLNQYFNMMLSCIQQEDGDVDKLVGDEIMAVFNFIEGKDHPCIRAIRASIAMRESLELFNQMRSELELQNLFFGVGINHGNVICGNIGSFDRMDYTVIGDHVNIAARLCSNARQDEILISSTVAKQLPKNILLEELKPLSVKGKSKPLHVYKVK